MADELCLPGEVEAPLLNIIEVISQFAISNPISAGGKNYRSLIDDDGECSNTSSVMKWKISSKAIENTV